jgi:AAA15 family ATPase/GTPase
MLIKYIVSNFKSIGHPVEFSMLPTKNDIEERFFKTISTKAGEWKVLRRGGFFGPNASGKSTFIESLKFAKDFIVQGQKSGKSTGVDQFRGNFKDLNNKTHFQFMFYLNQEVYEYGFTLDRKQVYEEWLLVLTEKGFVPMFTRVTDNNGKTEIDIESKFANKGSKDRKLAEALKEGIQENQKNQLFLYKLHDNGIKKAESIVSWFKGLQIIFPNTKIQGLPILMKEDEEFQKFIADNLRRLDTGVFNISVVNDEIDFKELSEKLDLSKDLVEDIEEIKNGIINLNGKYYMISENKNKRTVLVQIQFEHNLNDATIKFNIEEESDGTQRLLDLLPILFAMDKKSTVIYFVDEIDRSLHTKLSQHLMEEFIHRCESMFNQIIFTAHDVNLINLNSFSQDEIWFIEKNQVGESKLKPLSDFKVEKGQDALKAYLNGRFGAVPVIRGDK